MGISSSYGPLEGLQPVSEAAGHLLGFKMGFKWLLL